MNWAEAVSLQLERQTVHLLQAKWSKLFVTHLLPSKHASNTDYCLYCNDPAVCPCMSVYKPVSLSLSACVCPSLRGPSALIVVSTQTVCTLVFLYTDRPHTCLPLHLFVCMSFVFCVSVPTCLSVILSESACLIKSICLLGPVCLFQLICPSLHFSDDWCRSCVNMFNVCVCGGNWLLCLSKIIKPLWSRVLAAVHRNTHTHFQFRHCSLTDDFQEVPDTQTEKKNVREKPQEHLRDRVYVCVRLCVCDWERSGLVFFF